MCFQAHFLFTTKKFCILRILYSSKQKRKSLGQPNYYVGLFRVAMKSFHSPNVVIGYGLDIFGRICDVGLIPSLSVLESPSFIVWSFCSPDDNDCQKPSHVTCAELS